MNVRLPPSSAPHKGRKKARQNNVCNQMEHSIVNAPTEQL